MRSANWTSYYGLEKAACLKPLPFLALRVSRTDVGMQDLGRQGQFLFAISSEKPTGVNDGCYFTLGSSLNIEKKTLRVEPPLSPGGHTLYVHTFPRLLEDAQFQISPAIVPHLPHRLDESSFLAFCGSVLEVYAKFLKRANDARSSGGSEPVEDGWDSWSGESPYEYEHDRGGYVFEYLEPQNFNMSAAVETTSVYHDLLLYNQLLMDGYHRCREVGFEVERSLSCAWGPTKCRAVARLFVCREFADLRRKPQGTCPKSLVDEDSF